MNINIENQIKNKIMIFTATLPRRKWLREARIRFKWPDVERHLEENYTPPSGFTLGECRDKYKFADNDSDRHFEMSWVFDLVPIEKPIAKAKRKTKSVQK